MLHASKLLQHSGTLFCTSLQALLSDACFKLPAPQLWVSTCERQGYNGNVTAGNLKQCQRMAC